MHLPGQYKFVTVLVIPLLLTTIIPAKLFGAPPIIDPAPTYLRVMEGSEDGFLITASDDDGITMLTAESLPPHSTFIDLVNDTANFHCAPLPGDAGCYNVRFIASDIEGYSDTTECVVTYIPQSGGIDICEGDAYSYTPSSRNSYFDFATMPIPADYFGPGSDPFDGIISLKGDPLYTGPPGVLGSTDMIIRRLEIAELPACGSSDQIEIELVALSLVSLDPITVTYDGGQNPEPWDVRICLSSAVPQDTGSMVITRECNEGGSFIANILY